ncbi:hypothetical protein AJ80_09865 [Polytolypa hystricis UAMH7299]|uniref:Zn(2)-C6 fungal-type domain-containing protein n=1 Tax=Polytolypa hystricis (strain UAMH7299) TaxID=1447883 RepID=A0A2B7WHW4_POLH7|nr:hypothetical protein AJ80_09865 [Polytolypa hystricis UAMH7299]
MAGRPGQIPQHSAFVQMATRSNFVSLQNATNVQRLSALPHRGFDSPEGSRSDNDHDGLAPTPAGSSSKSDDPTLTGSETRDNESETHRNKRKKSNAHPVRHRIRQACDACRARRTRCSDERPCRYCAERGLSCTDMPMKERSDEATIRDVERVEQGLLSLQEAMERRMSQVEGLLQARLRSPGRSEVAFKISSADDAKNSRERGREVPNDTYPIDATLEPPSGDKTWVWQLRNGRLVPTVEAIANLHHQVEPMSPMRPFPPRFSSSDYLTLDELFYSLSKSYDFEECCRAEEEASRHFLNHSWADNPVDRNTCKQLSDEYFQKVNTWFPILSRDGWVREYRAASQGDDLSSAIILLTLALGAISASPLTHDEPLPGYEYFMKACATMGHDALRPSLQALRLYFLYAMQPILAVNAISDAANMAWLLWRYQAWKSGRDDDDFDAYLRVFWSCAVLEEEMALHVRRHTTGIDLELNLEKHLPNVTNDSPSGFFLAEIQIRRLSARLLTDVFQSQSWTERLIVVGALKLQREDYHNILPSTISFPTDSAEELFDDQKCFLRMQFHCFSIGAGWPTILSVLEDSDDENSRKLDHPSQSVLIKDFFTAMVLLLKAAPQQLRSRGPCTWLACEAIIALLIYMLLCCTSRPLRAFRPGNWLSIGFDVLAALEPWAMGCPRLRYQYICIKETFYALDGKIDPGVMFHHVPTAG